MHATVFEINKWSDSLDSNQHQLVIEIGKYFLNYVIVNKDHQVQVLKYLQTTPQTEKDWYVEMIDILQTESLLQHHFQQAVVVYSLPEQMLIPESYFDIDHNRAMLDLMHGDLQKGVTLSEKVQGWDAYNVYRVPTELHQHLQQHFSNIQPWHPFTLALQYGDKIDSLRSDKILVSFYQHTMMLVVIKNKNLQLVQQVAYQTAEDAAFYLLQACHTHELSPATCLLMLDGMIDTDSSVYRELHKYFGTLVFNELPAGIPIPDKGDAYPDHFFSPLMKMTLCVL